MLFSIVIPLYNKAAEIGRTIDSVLAQSFTDFELIVVDDGSTDSSAEIVRRCVDSRVRLVSKANGGVCSARNCGIAESSADYVAFLDADDCWDPDYLSEQVKMIADFPMCAMWGINFAELNGGRLVRRLETGLPEGYRGVVTDYFNMPGRVSDLFCSSSVVIRKEAFGKAGIFDERLKYSEDVDMWWRIIADFPVAFYDRYMAFYNHDASDRAMTRLIRLDSWLPGYPEKYACYKGVEPFYTWSQRWCAIKLKQLYFSSEKEERKRILLACAKLDYSVLPVKYRVFFKMPYVLANLAYKVKP